MFENVLTVLGSGSEPASGAFAETLKPILDEESDLVSGPGAGLGSVSGSEPTSRSVSGAFAETLRPILDEESDLVSEFQVFRKLSLNLP